MTITEIQIKLIKHLTEKHSLLDSLHCVGNNDQSIFICGDIVSEIIMECENFCRPFHLEFVLCKKNQRRGIAPRRIPQPRFERALFVNSKRRGTIGLVVKIDGESQMLSAAHSFYDLGKHTGEVIATTSNGEFVARACAKRSSVQSDMINLVDVSPKVENAFRNAKGKLRRCNLSKKPRANPGMRLLSLGASGCKLGNVFLKDVWVNTFSTIKPMILEGCFIVSHRTKGHWFSSPGDSGAIVVTEVGLHPVGMVIGSNLFGTVCQPYFINGLLLIDCLEANEFGNAIRLKTNKVLQRRIAHLLKRRPGCPSNSVERHYASFTYQAGSWSKPCRIAFGVRQNCPQLSRMSQKGGTTSQNEYPRTANLSKEGQYVNFTASIKPI